jgi:hypothetical protein
VKHGTVIFFSATVFGVYWLSKFGDASLETQLERLYFLTPMYFCVVFIICSNRSRELEERLKKLESDAAARENATKPRGSVND